MSISADSELSKRTEGDGTELEENVSRISIKPRCSQFKSIITRVILAVLFLAFGVGAVVYSVVNSEKDENSSTIPFNLRKSQHCDDDGLYIEEYANYKCTNGQCTNNSSIIQQTLKWKQNNEGKEIELIYNQGRKYVRISNVTITRSEEDHNCTCNTEMNYDTFINGLCVDFLRRNTSEEAIKIDDVEMYRYYGVGSCKINGFSVSIEAFSRTSDDTVYSWEVHFEEASPMVRMKYLFPSMKSGSISLDLEKTC